MVGDISSIMRELAELQDRITSLPTDAKDDKLVLMARQDDLRTRAARIADSVDDLSRMRCKRATLPVECNTTTASIEEPEAKFCLEPGNLAADARLSETKALRGQGHACGLGDGKESPQVIGIRHIRGAVSIMTNAHALMNPKHFTS